MELNLLEKFLLIALDSKKGKFLIDTLSLNYGLAGAILIELSEQEKIEIKNKKVVLLNHKKSNSEVLNIVIDLIENSRKTRRIKFWVSKISNKASIFKKIILKNLRERGVILINKKEFIWGLIAVYRYPVMKDNLISDIKSKLKAIVLRNEKAEVSDVLLLSLIYSCKLTRIICPNKKDYNKAKKRIKELTKDLEISGEINDALKGVQTALMVATTSAFVGASSSS